jgi:hypothetical protein
MAGQTPTASALGVLGNAVTGHDFGANRVATKIEF